MGQIGVSEAARRLGVSVARVHQRIADGTLPAVRIGPMWVIDEASLLHLPELSVPGRRLSARSSWAVVAATVGRELLADSLAPAERSRARQRLLELLASATASPSESASRAVAAQLRSMLRNRADRRVYQASPSDLLDLRADPRLRLSGLSHPASGLSSADVVEGYVASGDVEEVVEHHLLTPAPQKGNVVLHVLPVSPPLAFTPVAALAVAADLAEHHGPREERRAFELVRQIAIEQPDVNSANARGQQGSQ